MNLYGFPASACISVNDELIHGIPGNRVIQEGDIVTIDVGACLDGYHGDNAATFAAGTPSEEARRLMDVTRESLFKGIEMATAGITNLTCLLLARVVMAAVLYFVVMKIARVAILDECIRFVLKKK